MELMELNTETYKKRKITTVWATRNGDVIGHFWIVDGNRELGFQSHKDAKAFISGWAPRWKPVNLS